MIEDAPWPVPITTLGPVTGGTMVWRSRGQLYVTAVVKATFTLVAGADMIPAEPEEIFRSEMHYRNNPSRTVRVTGDLAPYLNRADVVFTGTAHPPEGRPVRRMSVRLGVYREKALIQKTLSIIGERKGGGEPKPFDQMPLVYERAYGGVGWADNPFGTGFTTGTAGTHNIVDPANPNGTVGLGPISRSWPERRKRLGGLATKALDQRLVELPEGFDFTFFQSAPADQRVDVLEGEEWIVLEGFHPRLPRLQSRLPSARGAAFVCGLTPDKPDLARRIEMRADTLRIDGDRQCCSLVWRGAVAVAAESQLASLWVAGAVSLHQQPIDWSRAVRPQPLMDEPTIDIEEEVEEDIVTLQVHGTLAISEETLARKRPAIPFGPASRRSSPALPSAPIPGAPWSVQASAPVIQKENTLERTQAIDFDPADDLDAAPSHIPPPPAFEPLPPPAPLAPPSVAPPPLPRAKAPPAPPSAPSVSVAPPVAPPAAPPAKAEWSWAPQPETPPVQPAKPPRPPTPGPPPKTEVKKTLYGGFGPKK
jgi:hypothetical protein